MIRGAQSAVYFALWVTARIGGDHPSTAAGEYKMGPLTGGGYFTWQPRAYVIIRPSKSFSRVPVTAGRSVVRKA